MSGEKEGIGESCWERDGVFLIGGGGGRGVEGGGGRGNGDNEAVEGLVVRASDDLKVDGAGFGDLVCGRGWKNCLSSGRNRR